jgi:hypothetical protein
VREPLVGSSPEDDLDGAERDYYVRQCWDKKVSADVLRMSSRASELYGRMCADQNERDHAELIHAIGNGSIEAVPDV